MNRKEPQAFKHLFDMLYAPLCYFAFKLVADREDAKDLVSRTFEVMWNRKQEFNDLNHLKSFMYLVTRNACISHLSAKRNLQNAIARIADDIPDSYYNEAIDESEILRILYNAIDTLPPRCREAFLLTQVEGLSREVAANKMGVSPNTLKKQLQIASDKLRSLLGDKNLALAIFLAQYGYFNDLAYVDFSVGFNS